MKKLIKLILFILVVPLFAQNTIALEIRNESGNSKKNIDLDQERVCISYCEIKNIELLGNLKKAKDIELIGILNLRNTNFLKSLNQIEYITLDACVNLRDISSIFNLPRLQAIIIRNCPSIEIDRTINLANSINLEYLQFADCKISTFPKIINIPQSMKNINFSGNSINGDFNFDGIDNAISIYMCGNTVPIVSDRVKTNISEMYKSIPVKYLRTY